MSAKRRNENGQMRREEYEAQDDDAGGEGPGEFSRASDEVMKKRRIVSVSKKFGSRGGGGGGGGAPGGGGGSAGIPPISSFWAGQRCRRSASPVLRAGQGIARYRNVGSVSFDFRAVNRSV